MGDDRVSDMTGIEEKFARIGARALLHESVRLVDLRIDISRDRRGEVFVIEKPPALALDVLDVRPKDRHLVLLARGKEKSRFLCGHDERHWFVAAIPESAPVTTVAAARDALKPPLVREAEAHLEAKARGRRRNRARIRQGEWFFVPAPRVRAAPG